jgi:hypothetical protein
MATVTGISDLDVELQYPGLRLPVTAGPNLRESKWRGGVFVAYVTAAEDFVVEVSDGNTACGFLLFASENYLPFTPPSGTGVGSPDNWTSFQPATGVGGQNVVTIIADNTRAFFRVFETVALAGGVRAGGPITYNLMDDLYVSENGLLCNDPPAQLALAGIATPVLVGIVSAVPLPRNDNRLGVDVHF